jgi:uncharacterized glyoxalase superfamily protein PhnB
VGVHFLDSLHQEHNSRGEVIRQPPTNMPWGVREMKVQDPNGHRFRMGCHSKGPAEDGLKRFSEIEQFGQ